MCLDVFNDTMLIPVWKHTSAGVCKQVSHVEASMSHFHLNLKLYVFNVHLLNVSLVMYYISGKFKNTFYV